MPVSRSHYGRLVTQNYGKSVHLTEETIETEAVNHFCPGERILSLGNIGCMLNCKYCYNWKTSQARHVADKDVFSYTPEAVEELLPVIDIFSISIKKINPDFYRKITTGWLEPVLAATKQVYAKATAVPRSLGRSPDTSDSAARKAWSLLLLGLVAFCREGGNSRPICYFRRAEWWIFAIA